MLKRIKKNPFLILSCIFILTFIDQVTKYLSFKFNLSTQGFIFLANYKNTGSAFSMFSGIDFYNILIICFSIIFLIYSIYYYKKYLKVIHSQLIIFILIISGLLGNLIDRVFLGYVRDFIGVNYFAIFNIADVYLSCAAIYILYLEFFDKKSLK